MLWRVSTAPLCLGVFMGFFIRAWAAGLLLLTVVKEINACINQTLFFKAISGFQSFQRCFSPMKFRLSWSKSMLGIPQGRRTQLLNILSSKPTTCQCIPCWQGNQKCLQMYFESAIPCVLMSAGALVMTPVIQCTHSCAMRDSGSFQGN